MFLIQFDYFTYCQGTRDKNRTSVLTNANNFETAQKSILADPTRWEEACNFKSCTVDNVVDSILDGDKKISEESMQSLESSFVSWLQNNNLYDERESTNTIKRMFEVWLKCREESI